MREATNLIAEYIKEDELETLLKDIPIIHSQKLKAAISGNISRLRALRDFQLSTKSCVKAIRIGNRIVGIYPNKVLAGKIADMHSTIDYELLRHSAQKVYIKNNNLIIEGCAFVRYIPTKRRKAINIQAWIVDEERTKIRRLQLTQRKTKRPEEIEKTKNSNKIKYDGAGFRIVIKDSDVLDLKKGRYRVEIVWESSDYHREAILGRMKYRDEDKIKGSKFPGAENITFDSTLNREPVIVVGD